VRFRPVVNGALALSVLLLRLVMGVAAVWAIPFSAPTSYATDGECEYVAAGDLNGDGYADLVSSNDASLSVFLNDGDGMFVPKVDTVWEASLAGLDTGNLDGDGKVDVAVANTTTNTLRVYWGSGDGTFAAMLSDSIMIDLINDRVTPLEGAIADVDADGRPDYVVIPAGDDTVAAGSGTPRASSWERCPPTPTCRPTRWSRRPGPGAGWPRGATSTT